MPSSQTRGIEPVQVPPTQVSTVVQALLSLQTVPFGAAGATQPSVLSHASTVHGLPSSHVMGVPMQAPVMQASDVVQALPSLHATPSSEAHVPVPAWHTTQSFGLPPPQALAQHTPSTHWLFEHWSLAVHDPPRLFFDTQLPLSVSQ